MAQKNRTKEIWLIPKRVNLHQTICLIDGIIERKYNGTSWNESKQNNLGVNLKKWGATRDGRNISHQAVRTLVASIPQYLGFIYINTNTTPSTICLTEAGMALWNKHKRDLVKIPNLVEGKDLIIKKSECVLRQMEKLQITNPVILKDCENILVFPFRFMLKVLLQTVYLDNEEIAYFLFKVRSEDEVDLTVQAIENFRQLSKEKRESLMNAFKRTHIGNITLVKASSAGYFISLCQITGIIDKLKVSPNNVDGNLPALKINEKYIDYVKDIIDKKYDKAEVFDFTDNLELWVEYMGNPDIDYPPINVNICNETNSNYIVVIEKGGNHKYSDMIEAKGLLQFPMFVYEKYNVVLIDCISGDEVNRIEIEPTFDIKDFSIEFQNSATKIEEDIIEIGNEILEHCKSNNFSKKTLAYLKVLENVTGVDKQNDKSLRGAYFEYLVYKLLLKLKDKGVVDDVVWNGKVGKYGLPSPAPGGRLGTADVVFMIDDNDFVLELTTIKPKSTQFSAEGSSVPDHIRIYADSVSRDVTGIFCAPKIHSRNTAAMQSTISHYGIELHCITDEELVELLLKEDKEEIKKYFGIS